MSASADAMREARHKRQGGKRVTARVSGDAYARLVLVSMHRNTTIRAVLEQVIADMPMSDHSDNYGLSESEVAEARRLGVEI
jgi:hypothetical protein